MRFLAIGECMAELAPAEGSSTFTLGYAGDTFNTAWYISRILPSADVSFLTAIGDDRVSREMRSFLTESGISDAHVRVIPGKTIGLYMIHLQDGERSFSYWRENSAARQLAADPVRLGMAMEGQDVAYFSGITLAILPPAARSNLFDALQIARKAGCKIAFDPNLRPRLWADTAKMKSVVTEAATFSDFVLPSFEDEATWFGDRSPDETLARYLSAGAETVIVKNSAATVVYGHSGQMGEVAVDPVAGVVDTTAAGDSFNAACLTSILAGKAIESAIDDGCSLAGHVVRQKGALVPVADIGLRARA